VIDESTDASNTAPAGEAAEADEADSRVTALELVCFTAAAAIGLLSLVSLAAAHLHQNRPAVVFPIAIALVLVVGAVVVFFDRPRVTGDRWGLLIGAAAIVAAAVMFIPGFHYATSDRDPGGYVMIATEIQKSHSVEFANPLNNPSLPAVARPLSVQQGWPGLWNSPFTAGKIFPQFYHLWPALMASAKDVAGWRGLFNIGPLVGIIAVGLTVAVARRIAGLIGAGIAGVVMAFDMLEVWQAKYPSSEIFGQMLFLGALAGVVIAIRTRWRSAAALAGVFVGLGYLERADGLVVVLIAWGILAALLAARRFDVRAGWFTAGLVVMLPYGFYQAYHLARRYTVANGVPSLHKVLLIMIGLAVVGALLAWQGSLVRRVMDWSAHRNVRATLGAAFVAVCAVAMIVGFLRPRLFGKDYNASGRTFDEISLVRLSWFFSLTGFALLGAGIVWIAMRRWRTENWIIAFTAIPLLALYCYHVRNSPYLMWDFRRFVTTVVPGIAILIGAGVAWSALALRWILARIGPLSAPRLGWAVSIVGVVAVAVGLSVFYISESGPLRHHNENGGSLQVEQRIAALAGGQQGAFFWNGSGACCARPSLLFGGALLTLGGQPSALAPNDPKQLDALLTYYTSPSSGAPRPVFYIVPAPPQTLTMPGLRFSVADHLVGSLPHWAETYTSRPKMRTDYRYDFTVYRVSTG
jgi:hypothetical protein